MPTYDPVKSYEEDTASAFTLTSNANANANANAVDVELALIKPSKPIQHHNYNNINTVHSNQHQHPPPPRLVSLDVFRGFTVALMILVDYAGGILPAINHSPWNGLTLADLVMPFFLFIVGVSLGLAYKAEPKLYPKIRYDFASAFLVVFSDKLPCKAAATRKALLRTLKLSTLGLFLQGGYLHGLNDLTYGVNVDKIRFMGILQRIAIAYLVGALCEIWLIGDDHVDSSSSLLRKYRFQWVTTLMLISTYLSLLYVLYVPDWEYQIPAEASFSAPKIFSVKCGVRGDVGPACNAVGLVDRTIMGIQHLYREPIYARTKLCSINSPDYGPLPADAPSWCQAPFDPEGILSSMMAMVTCLVGLHYGHIIVHFKEHGDRIFHWMVPSTILIGLGLALDFLGMHVNKALYSFSYMSVTAGSAGILFSGIYKLVDVCGYRRMTLVLKWMGMHALMIYIIAACNILPLVLQGFYWKQPQNNILRFIGIGR